MNIKPLDSIKKRNNKKKKFISTTEDIVEKGKVPQPQASALIPTKVITSSSLSLSLLSPSSTISSLSSSSSGLPPPSSSLSTELQYIVDLLQKYSVQWKVRPKIGGRKGYNLFDGLEGQNYLCPVFFSCLSPGLLEKWLYLQVWKFLEEIIETVLDDKQTSISKLQKQKKQKKSKYENISNNYAKDINCKSTILFSEVYSTLLLPLLESLQYHNFLPADTNIKAISSKFLEAYVHDRSQFKQKFKIEQVTFIDFYVKLKAYSIENICQGLLQPVNKALAKLLLNLGLAYDLLNNKKDRKNIYFETDKVNYQVTAKAIANLISLAKKSSEKYLLPLPPDSFRHNNTNTKNDKNNDDNNNNNESDNDRSKNMSSCNKKPLSSTNNSRVPQASIPQFNPSYPSFQTRMIVLQNQINYLLRLWHGNVMEYHRQYSRFQTGIVFPFSPSTFSPYLYFTNNGLQLQCNSQYSSSLSSTTKHNFFNNQEQESLTTLQQTAKENSNLNVVQGTDTTKKESKIMHPSSLVPPHFPSHVTRPPAQCGWIPVYPPLNNSSFHQHKLLHSSHAQSLGYPFLPPKSQAHNSLLGLPAGAVAFGGGAAAASSSSSSAAANFPPMSSQNICGKEHLMGLRNNNKKMITNKSNNENESLKNDNQHNHFFPSVDFDEI